MNFIIFQIRRFFIFLAESFIFPFLKFRELWADPRRGRSMIFGLPALLVALVGVIALLVAVGSQSRFLSNYEVAKKRAEQDGNWNEAIVYMRKIMQLRPNDDATKWELAKVLNSDDREETSEANRQRAIAILNSLSPNTEPGYPPAHVWRANQFLSILDRRVPMQLKIQKAEEHLRFALDTDPGNVDALILLAERILIPKREYQEALDIYVDLFKEYVGYYVKITELYVVLERPEGAHPYLEQAISRYTKLLKSDHLNPDYLRRRANAYAMLGKHDEAAESLIAAMDEATDPLVRKQIQVALSRIYLARAMVFAEGAQNEPESRNQFLDWVILAYQTDPENDAAKTSLTRFGFSGFDEAPRALYVYDPRDNPEDATHESLSVAGTHEVLNGDRLLGISLLELATQKNPRNHEALNNLAFTIMDTELERALSLVNRAVAAHPKAEYLDTRGNIYMRLSDWSKATNDLEQALKMLQRDKRQPSVQLYEALVECYRQQGMVSSAASYQKKVDELKAQEENNQDENNDDGSTGENE